MDGIKESDAILASVAAWANDTKNGQMIEFAHGTAGGWEGWAQVEIANRLYKDHGATFGLTQYNNIVREAKIYTSSTRAAADIVLYRNGKASAGSYIIELKCESSGNSGNFATEVIEDLDKVQGGFIQGITTGFVWVIGLDFTHGAKPAQKLPAAGFKIYDYASGPLKIWWQKRRL